MSRVALGFKPRTGRAVVVVLAGDVRHPEVLERKEIPLLPEGEWAPYHAVEGLPTDDADRKVKQSIAEARRMATSAIRAIAQRCVVRSTGIGCYFDDEMHGLLGIDDDRWQSLYHFTVGGPIDDTRLVTLPPYAFQP